MSHLVKKFRIAADRSITFGNFMDKLADMYGDKTCFILDRPMKYSFMTGDRQSYNQWREYTDRVANVLVKDLGVQPGERVIVDMSNRMEIPFTCFALMKIGAVAVPLNFMLTAKEISYIAGTPARS